MQNRDMCHWCGMPTQIIWVHGHGQCASCGINIAPCCDGGLCDPPISSSDNSDVAVTSIAAESHPDG